MLGPHHRHAEAPHAPRASSPASANALMAFAEWAVRSPQYGQLQARLWHDLALLWQRSIEREQGRTVEPVAVPDPADKRFASPEWQSNAIVDFVKQSYLLNARFVQAAVESAGIDPHLKGQLRFYARQLVDACAPSNFAAFNPDVLKAALATNGETFKRGVQNLIEDLGKGRVSNVDETAFEVGRNVAVTPGDVIFENELLQLIRYRPLAEKVHARPLVMIPPCINKFYVLDLQPDTSFVRFAVESGHTVYMVSWRNPADAKAPEARRTWDDYIEEGVIRALATVRAAAGAERINVLGFCVGGTMLSTALAVLASRGERWVESLTLLATLLDFSDTGEIGCFVDEPSVAAREAELAAGGLLTGRELALVFSALRDNDLIWSYVVNNYLKGERPAAFDILYWNADSTNLPGPFFTWYLRHMYLQNELCRPRTLQVCGAPVDLGAVRVPTYIVATRDDHIVPWTSAYRSTALLGKPVRFVLGASGHIAGIINPAAKNRRNFWVDGPPGATPDAWLAGARSVPGSWWTDWSAWLASHASWSAESQKLVRTLTFPDFQAALTAANLLGEEPEIPEVFPRTGDAGPNSTALPPTGHQPDTEHVTKEPTDDPRRPHPRWRPRPPLLGSPAPAAGRTSYRRGPSRSGQPSGTAVVGRLCRLRVFGA